MYRYSFHGLPLAPISVRLGDGSGARPSLACTVPLAAPSAQVTLSRSRTKNLKAARLLLGIRSCTMRYLGIEVDDALEMAEQTNVVVARGRWAAHASVAHRPRAATHRQPVSLARVDTQMTAVRQCPARALGGLQLGNFNSRSIAWKRGSLRKGCIRGSVAGR